MKKQIIIEVQRHNQGQFETLKIDILANLKKYRSAGLRFIMKEKIGRKQRRIE